MSKEKHFDFCSQCRKEAAYFLRKKTVKQIIRDKEYEFEITTAICESCGAEMYFHGLLDLNAKEIDEQYRKANGIVSIDDIKKIMQIYNIGKAPLSIALGFGEITVTRYLAGQIPSKEYSDIIKKALSSPNYMVELLNKNSEKIGEAAYRKSISAAEEIANMFCLSDRMILTISYIFEQMQEVTPLALQKLLYFTQGIHMVMFGNPMFTEDCMAWVHGPVYEKVYNLFKDFKYNPIEDDRFAIFKQRFTELEEPEKIVIDLVINTFGKYSGKVLEDITHEEAPWKNARVGYAPTEPSKEIIGKKEIKKYFSNVSKKYDLTTEKGINAYIMSYM